MNSRSTPCIGWRTIISTKDLDILIVDDEVSCRRLARSVLAPLGYHLREAADGAAALEAVRQKAPDLILLDVKMPKRDGYSVCAFLKQNAKTKLIPIIMLTSLQHMEDKIKGIESGVDEFLAKPFNVAELAARVKSLLARKRYTDELENVSVVLQGIASVVEKRDAYTSCHCKRVGDYGAGIALAMGLGIKEVNAIRLAGTLHDLGKIAIPDSILLKPGPLSEQERKIIKTHASIGAALVKPMTTMAVVLPFIRHHHERLDGTGYPDGIAGKEISLSVRILSVVDIYDALASRRPYKEAFEQIHCLAILRDEVARGWWDRDVVEYLAKSLVLPIPI